MLKIYKDFASLENELKVRKPLINARNIHFNTYAGTPTNFNFIFSEYCKGLSVFIVIPSILFI
jgi:hypothetical protein